MRYQSYTEKDKVEDFILHFELLSKSIFLINNIVELSPINNNSESTLRKRGITVSRKGNQITEKLFNELINRHTPGEIAIASEELLILGSWLGIVKTMPRMYREYEVSRLILLISVIGSRDALQKINEIIGVEYTEYEISKFVSEEAIAKSHDDLFKNSIFLGFEKKHISTDKMNREQPKRQCVKVGELRKIGYNNLEEWIKDENNLYVGRRGRLWITEYGEKRIFHYPQSKWHNPYKSENIHEIIFKYAQHIKELSDTDILELQGKNIGCFCKPGDLCHSDVLIKIYNEGYDEALEYYSEMYKNKNKEIN